MAMTANARMRKWRSENPEARRQADRRARLRHPEKFRAKYRRQYANNAAKRATAARERRAVNREAYNARARERRAADPTYNRLMAKRRNLLPLVLDISEVRALLERQGFRCYYCWRPISRNGYEIDHFYPLAAGGAHHHSNMVAACPSCNRHKSSLDPFAFFKRIGVEVESLRRAA